MRCVTGIMAVLGCLLVGSTAAGGNAASRVAPGEVLVLLRGNSAEGRDGGGNGKQAVSRLLNRHGGGQMRSLCRDETGKALRRIAAKRGRRVEGVTGRLQRVLVVRFDADEEPAAFAARLAKLPEVERAEPRFIRRTSLTPNDTYYGQSGQNFFGYHGFPAAWDTTTGSDKTVIAIVDSGVDYTHPDLDGKQWVNPGEIADNDIDDDDNGYVDDVIGWDFWQRGTITDPVDDNNPIGEHSDHGTHVAGIAAAATNNGTGIAGTGFDCVFMAIKAGGTRDYPDDIGFGIEGILYAAANGADVINCSWGSSGSSWFEEFAVDTAVAAGAVVVCAAGNENWATLSFPAAYPNAFAVGSVGTSDSVKSSFSNFGYWVDVFAAGESIKSTLVGTGYGSKSGTSMSTPVVSGLAGLLKTVHTDWSSEQVMAQIRASAVSIEAQNDPGLAYKLGAGRIDAAAAVGTALPGFTVEETSLLTAEGRPPWLGESGTLTVTLKNWNAAAGDMTFTLESLTSGITVSSGTVDYGAFGAGATDDVGFSVTLAEDLDLLEPLVFVLGMQDGSRSWQKNAMIEVTDLLSGTVAANKITMTVTSTGTVGYVNGIAGTGGVGFVPRTDEDYGWSLLYEGALMVEAGGVLIDQARAEDDMSQDFRPLSGYAVTTPGDVSDADGKGRFDSSGLDTAPALSIGVESFAFDDETVDQCVLLQYTIHNPAAYGIDNVYVGLFNDWDIGYVYTNATVYNSANDVLYVYDQNDQSEPYVAVVPLVEASSLFAIDNGFDGTVTDLDFGLYYTAGDQLEDGFTDTEKVTSLKAGTQRTSRTQADVSTVVGSGPYTIPAGEDIVVGFIYAYGDSASDLFAQVNAARALGTIQPTPVGTVQPANEAPAVEIVTPATETVFLADATSVLVLEADLSDDGKPTPAGLSCTWSQVAGPSGVVFEDDAAADTVAAFPGAGVYELALDVSDGLLTSQATVTVIVAADSAFADGLQAFWTFDDVAGAVVPDSSGSGRDGTVSGGITIEPGQVNDALEFDGDTGRVAFDAPALSQMTFMGWLKPYSEGNSTFPRILDMPGFYLYAGRDASYTDTDDTLRFYTDWTVSTGIWYTSPGTIEDDEWMHVAVTYDAGSDSNVPVFYINGERVESYEYLPPAGTAPDNTGSGSIGNSVALDRAWDGLIDEVRIYDRILTASEISELLSLPPENVGPTVDAGDGGYVSLAGEAQLQGSVSDDGLPGRGYVDVQWYVAAGPGDAEFADANALSTSVTFSLAGDYTLRLVADDGAIAVADDVVLTVTDQAVVAFAARSSTPTEGVGLASVVVTLAEGATENVTVDYAVVSATATQGEDYVLAPDTLVFSPGVVSQTIDIPITDDVVIEGTETITLALSAPSGALLGLADHVVSIVDNDMDVALSVKHAQVTEIRLGVRTGATADYDLGIDTATESSGDAGTAYVRFLNAQVSDPEQQELAADIRSESESILRWRLLVTVPEGRGETTTFSWDSSTFDVGPDRRLLLQKLDGETPVGGAIDLTVSRSLAVTSTTEFEIAYGKEEAAALYLDLDAGWNLAGIPLMTSQAVSDILGDAAYPRSVWVWGTNRYDHISPGSPPPAERALWIYSTSGGRTRAIHGLRADGLYDVHPGWRTFTPVPETPIPVTALPRIIIYSWNPADGSYLKLTDDDDLERLDGYWFHTLEELLLDFGEE